jgi:RNA polymerase sigma-54 factor
MSALTQGISGQLKTQQNLSITPQLQEAIKLLQLSAMELKEFVEQKVIENPFLSLEGSDEDHGDVHDNSYDDFEEDTNLWGGMDSHASFKDGIRSKSRHVDIYDELGLDYLSHIVTLKEYLHQQLIHHPKMNSTIAIYLIDLLDDRGYVLTPMDQIARELNVSLTDVCETLENLQHFDPPGIFARSLKECLRLQLMDQEGLSQKMGQLLDVLETFENFQIEKLAKASKLKIEECQELLKRLQTLNPNPAYNFDVSLAPTRIADVMMFPHPKGGWKIELNPSAFPDVVIEADYYHSLKRTLKKEQDHSYIQKHFTQASWLSKSLIQRSQTILNVAHEIIRRQEDFFAYGKRALKPMTLKEVADKLGIHESTVSRVTTQKYLHTPQGMYEFKYFFSQSVEGSMSGRQKSYSNKAIQQMIETLIQNETKSSPLSDQDLTVLLQQQGIDVARRTVAKYREMLTIPTSSIRKRQYDIRG